MADTIKILNSVEEVTVRIWNDDHAPELFKKTLPSATGLLQEQTSFSWLAMAKKVEADGKAEQELFDKYECWYKYSC